MLRVFRRPNPLRNRRGSGNRQACFGVLPGASDGGWHRFPSSPITTRRKFYIAAKDSFDYPVLSDGGRVRGTDWKIRIRLSDKA